MTEKKQCNEWLLYILECADKTLYTGITNRLDKRLAAHRSGHGAKYTRGRLPLKVVYTESCGDPGSAAKREHAVKKLTKKQKLELIENALKTNSESSF